MFMRTQTGVLGALAGLGLLCVGTSVQAMPTTELGLGIDGSGSISSSDFDLQIDAYRNVLTDPSVVPQDGSVAIGIWLFSRDVDRLFSTTVIDSSKSSVSDMDSALAGASKPGGLTDIAGTIDTAADDLLNNSISSQNQIIDISTDGNQTVTPGDPDTSASTAVSDGIDQVNCLGIGSGADCSFTAGPGAFSVTADTFGDFEQALSQKIQRETGQVPVPATLALFGLGLLALGGISYRGRSLG